MNLSTFKQVIRAEVPGAKIAVVGEDFLTTLINMGVDDVNAIAAAYRGDEKFDAEAEKQTYLFSAIITDYVCMAPGGLWWNQGTALSPNWKQLDGLTRNSMSSLWPQWLNASSNSPLNYFTENNNLIINPKPSADLTDGFWAFYVKKAVAMSSGGHYPFSGSTTEITSLSVLDEAIVDYVRWKLARPLGQAQQGVITEQDYRKNLFEKIILLNRRLDVTSNPRLRMRGPNFG